MCHKIEKKRKFHIILGIININKISTQHLNRNKIFPLKNRSPKVQFKTHGIVRNIVRIQLLTFHLHILKTKLK